MKFIATALCCSWQSWESAQGEIATRSWPAPHACPVQVSTCFAQNSGSSCLPAFAEILDLPLSLPHS